MLIRLLSRCDEDTAVPVFLVRQVGIRLISRCDEDTADSSFFSPESGDKSTIALTLRSSHSRFDACSSPVKSETLASLHFKRVSFCISSAVIAVSSTMLSSDAIASRRFTSGMSTIAASGRGSTLSSSGTGSTIVISEGSTLSSSVSRSQLAMEITSKPMSIIFVHRKYVFMIISFSRTIVSKIILLSKRGACLTYIVGFLQSRQICRIPHAYSATRIWR